MAQTETQALAKIETRREIRTVDDPIPVLDTARFEHMQRIANAIAEQTLCPAHLRGTDARQTAANCFRVVNQAVRWGFDPFAVVDETYVVQNKLGYQGKLVAAVVNAKAGLQQRLSYAYNDKAGDDLTITVTGRFIGEDVDRTVEVRVGTAKTNNKMWTADPRQKLIYSGAIKWARAHCPELLLGVLTDDDIDRMQMMGDLKPGPDGTYRPERPSRGDYRAAARHQGTERAIEQQSREVVNAERAAMGKPPLDEAEEIDPETGEITDTSEETTAATEAEEAADEATEAATEEVDEEEERRQRKIEDYHTHMMTNGYGDANTSEAVQGAWNQCKAELAKMGVDEGAPEFARFQQLYSNALGRLRGQGRRGR
jgi:hypothetical protein